ncbi:unnamed protein product, partial [Ectocarpus sp. 12 AP-2014]
PAQGRLRGEHGRPGRGDDPGAPLRGPRLNPSPCCCLVAVLSLPFRLSLSWRCWCGTRGDDARTLLLDLRLDEESVVCSAGHDSSSLRSPALRECSLVVVAVRSSAVAPFPFPL